MSGYIIFLQCSYKLTSYSLDKQAGLPDDERQQSDAKFKEISEAYSVLTDPRKKQLFDSGVDVDGASASGGSHGHGHGGFGGFDEADILRAFMQSQGGGRRRNPHSDFSFSFGGF